MKSTTSDGRKIESSNRKTAEFSKPVMKNLVTLTCSMCDTSIQVHKKHFASLGNCGKEGCPNGS